MYEWNGDGMERKRDATRVQIHAPPLGSGLVGPTVNGYNCGCGCGCEWGIWLRDATNREARQGEGV
jgi:hypothetical protein